MPYPGSLLSSPGSNWGLGNIRPNRESAMQTLGLLGSLTPAGDVYQIGQGLYNQDPYGVGLGLLSLALPGTISPGMARKALPEFIHAGPMTAKTTPLATQNLLGNRVYRETNPEGLEDLLLNNLQGGHSGAYVTDNLDLALGQGKNKGIMVEFSPEHVSGTIVNKPGMEFAKGNEFKLNYLGEDSIEKFTIPKGVKVRTSRLKRFAKNFDEQVLEDGTRVFTRK